MALLTSASIALSSCSTLPDYAAPKFASLDVASVDMSDVIPYRALSRDDFRGTQPPPQFAEYAERLGATTCAYIRTTPDTQTLIQTSVSSDGETIYRAVPDRVRFQALMDRSCSWWNPMDVGLQESYVLEHEQIHFALFELEARRLNASVAEIEGQLHATADTPEAAVQSVQRRIGETIHEGMKGLQERSREFDEDTSMGENPEKQSRWWDLVHSELAQTSHQGGAGDHP